MIKIYIENFATADPGENLLYTLENISDYCHGVSTDIKIYSYDERLYFDIFLESLTFPNVVYIDYLAISDNSIDLSVMFPDLTEVGKFSFYGYNINFGKLKKIDYFIGNYLTMPNRYIGNWMYRFTNKQTGKHWDIKINNFI